MASNLHNLKELIGETVVAIVVVESETRFRRGYIVLSDNTHVEVWVRDGGVAGRAPGGVREIQHQAARDGLAITGTWVGG